MNARRLPKSALVLTYLQVHLGEWVSNQDLRQVSGLDDVTRSLRDIRSSAKPLNTIRAMLSSHMNPAKPCISTTSTT